MINSSGQRGELMRKKLIGRNELIVGLALGIFLDDVLAAGFNVEKEVVDQYLDPVLFILAIIVIGHYIWKKNKSKTVSD